MSARAGLRRGECPLCGGPGVLLGALGAREHFRCRDCGAGHSRERRRRRSTPRRAPRDNTQAPGGGTDTTGATPRNGDSKMTRAALILALLAPFALYALELAARLPN